MSTFTRNEIEYLESTVLGRLATVGATEHCTSRRWGSPTTRS